MQPICVQGQRELLTPAGIKLYRQYGYIIALQFFHPKITHELSSVVRAAVRERGLNPFPALDPENNVKIGLDAGMRPRISAIQVPEVDSIRKNSTDAKSGDASSTVGLSSYAKRRLRQEKMIDRAFSKICKIRNISLEEGLRALQDRKIEKIDDALDYIFNTSKYWGFLWDSHTALECLVRGSLGALIGEAATALSGEVVVRLYSDGAYESQPFMNPTPFTFAATAVHFRSPHGLSVMIGLEDLDGCGHALVPRLAVMPGSHRILLSLTGKGIDLERFRVATHVFDMGHLLRQMPELHRLPIVQLPVLEPGTVLFMHNFVLNAMMPTMAGRASPLYVPPAAQPPRNPHLYSMALMPDHCTFDGHRTSWASRDSHGPLYQYKKGQLLRDDKRFPVLHRALDIE